jgi:hypothetical protein
MFITRFNSQEPTKNSFLNERCGTDFHHSELRGQLVVSYFFSGSWRPLENQDPRGVEFVITYNVSDEGTCRKHVEVCKGHSDGEVSGDKCFFIKKNDEEPDRNPDNPLLAFRVSPTNDLVCRHHGGDLASITDLQQLGDVYKLRRYHQEESVFIGYTRCGTRDPQMYRRMPCWADRTIGYFMFHINVVQMPYYSECYFFRETQLFPIDVDDCAIKQCGTLNEFRSHCEVKSKASRAAGKELPVMIALHRDVTLETNITVTLIPCPSSNHLTRLPGLRPGHPVWQWPVHAALPHYRQRHCKPK